MSRQTGGYPGGYLGGDYERPGRRWVCGHLAAGRPCPVGPDRRGRCTADRQSNCAPRLDGDRWVCTRPAPFGGQCPDGPLPDGSCCHPPPQHRPCRPRRSLRARRGALVAAIGILALGLAVWLLDGRWHLEWVSPGELSSPHAAIAGPTPARCGACHEAPGETAHGWLRFSFSAPARAQDERCLECHFGPLDAPAARSDHSVPAESLSSAATDSRDLWQGMAAVWGAPQRSAAGLACARCHQEHRGRAADITALDEVRCQACHAARFSGFDSHPALGAPLKPPSLAFDHVQHQIFWPDGRLVCADCHTLAADGGSMTTLAYRDGCAGCHSQGQDDFHGFAIQRRSHTVLQPSDMEVSENTPWPVASGVLVSPLMWMLLGGDDQALAALEDLYDTDDWGLESEPFEWYPDEERLKDEFAQAFYRLLEELADGDRDALTARLTALVPGAGGDPAAAFVDQLLAGQFALQAFRARWYGREPAVGEPWSPAKAASGWLVDPKEIAVQYRPTGHGDPFLRSWVEFLAQQQTAEVLEFRGRLMAALRDSLLSPGGWLYQSCTSCHRGAGATNRGSGWTQVPGRSPASGYARFTHRSHFDIRRGQESCASCHRAGEEGGPNRGFAAYRRDDCGQCHGELAPEDCLHCHNYHFVRP